MIADIDKDGSGTIDFEEFLQMMTAKMGERDSKVYSVPRQSYSGVISAKVLVVLMTQRDASSLCHRRRS